MAATQTDTLLALFAKAPLPGQVKTRLAHETSDAFAASLAEAFVRDCVHRYRNTASRRLLLFTPAPSEAWFRELAAGDFDPNPQVEGDLGARLSAFFANHSRHRMPVIALGTDSPNLPRAWVDDAFGLLTTADVVLGPAVDGGYYLIGCRGFFPGLFEIDGWGGSNVLGQTVERARALGLRLALLPVWYDVDTLADCRFLRQHLLAQRGAGIDPECERSEATLEFRL